MASLVGVYRLVEQVNVALDGNRTDARGEGAAGTLIYTAEGRMSVQLTRADRPVAGDLDALATALDEYLGYFGTYSVDENAGTVTHHVEGCSYSAWTGTDQIRFYEWNGTHLTLRAERRGGAAVTGILLWERLESGAIRISRYAATQ